MLPLSILLPPMLPLSMLLPPMLPLSMLLPSTAPRSWSRARVLAPWHRASARTVWASAGYVSGG
jgi:hypothetical protein